MKPLLEAFENIAEKSEVLLRELSNVRQELGETKVSMEELKGRLAEREHDLKVLKEENRMLKMAGAFKGDGENSNVTETKRRISAMVREIDRCIALMND